MKQYIRNIDQISTLIIFTSPEAIAHNKLTELVDMMIHQKVLSLIDIDELHQFVCFGLSFRCDFSKLKNKLFTKIIQTNKDSIQSQVLKLPVLFMMATTNNILLKNLIKLTGLSIYDPIITWGSIQDFKKRNIDIHLSTSYQYIRILKDKLVVGLKDNWKRRQFFTQTLHMIHKV